ncbi:hypothetical protein MKX01_003692 [Papaver californicum]|nr:hypothetical protein MKX01_003692 [Papaver californicum]
MGSRPGDWNCRSCQRCGNSRSGKRADFRNFGGRGSISSFGFSAGICGANNFASRSSCFKCNAFKYESAGGFDTVISRLRAGGGFGINALFHFLINYVSIYLCILNMLVYMINKSGCNEHNFASKMKCFRCNAPREYGSKSSYAAYNFK